MDLSTKHVTKLLPIFAEARKVLNWTPVATNEEAILLSVESMLKFGNIK